MGNTHAGVIISTVSTKIRARNIVVIGIAGSLNDDLSPGDVFIPTRVDHYMENAAAIGKNEWHLDTSGTQFATNKRLLNRFAHFNLLYKEYFDSWFD